MRDSVIRIANLMNRNLIFPPYSVFRREIALGLPSAIVERPHATIHTLYRVEESGYRRVQNRRSTWSGATLGYPEESSFYELRQNE